MDANQNRPRELIVHIGTGKAGSASIQSFLGANRQRLAELGVLYPGSGRGAPRHARLGLFVQSPEEIRDSRIWDKQKESDPVRFRRVFRRRLLAEIEESGLSRVLLSDEVLFHQNAEALRRLRRLTGRIADSLRLVAYLRRQDDHVVSRYQQGVKMRMTLRLSEYVRGDLSGMYDYHARLRAWQRLLKPTKFVVRRFEPDSFVAGSLHQDFLEGAGIDVRAEDLEPVPKRNESLDAESTEFLRLVNLCRVENGGQHPVMIRGRSLVRRLAASSTGPVLTLPDTVLDDFMAQWEESNRRIAVEVFGDASGQLFRMPRKRDNTTTCQRLDPARLDHFFQVTKLPEQVHAPLRRLAEREARLDDEGHGRSAVRS